MGGGSKELNIVIFVIFYGHGPLNFTLIKVVLSALNSPDFDFFLLEPGCHANKFDLGYPLI